MIYKKTVIITDNNNTSGDKMKNTKYFIFFLFIMPFSVAFANEIGVSDVKINNALSGWTAYWVQRQKRVSAIALHPRA